ncbi:MAG: hypothetical protein C5B50_04410 [Verrucomicrobia bacterium]|nr:MAG: hypothetical protein C5B50_04410 [Verrucomicrobiota bacterium]
MKPAIVILTVVAGLLAASLIFLHPKEQEARLKPNGPSAPASIEAAAAQAAVAAPAPPLVARAGRPDSVQAKQQTYVENRITELDELGRNDDRASLDAILGELNNRDPEIREAARNAAIQFGSRDAIPKLEDAIAQTDDPHEKAALADAIEFLKLPSITELKVQPLTKRPDRKTTDHGPRASDH